MKRKWDTNDETLQRKCISEVIARIDEIDATPAGIVAAQDIVDIVLQNLAPEIYNKGVKDTKKLLAAKFADIELDIDMLEQS